MTAAITKSDILNAPNKKQLQEYAKTYKIKNYSRISREELENRLIEAIGEPAPQPEAKKETPQQFFDRVSKVIDEAELKAECEKLLETLGTENLQPKSKSNKLRPYARRFKELTPSSCDLPKEMFFAFKAKGKSTAIDRHKFFEFTELANIDWGEAAEGVKDRKAARTGKSRGKDELADTLSEEAKIFSLEKYIATMTNLLNSSDPWENAVGLIAASGRRPFEIMIGGEFKSVDESPKYISYPEYAIQVSGLAKKRDKNPITIVPLLIPTEEFLLALERFRNNPEIVNLKNKYDSFIKDGDTEVDAANKIEDKFGKKIRNITGEYFSFIPKIDDGENRKNILLRACTMKIITMRDKPNSNTKARLNYAGLIAGHKIPIFKEDGTIQFDGNINAATMNYDDYEPDVKDIPLLSDVITIIENNEEDEEVKLRAEIEELKLELVSKNAQLKVRDDEIEKKTALLKTRDDEIEKLKHLIDSKNGKRILPETTEMTNEMLFEKGFRRKGSSDEKLNRVWVTIADYNDNATEFKLAPTSTILRTISGVNGNNVKRWIDEHKIMIDDHMNKHGLTAYYNNRYRNNPDMDVEKLVEIIKERL